MFCWDFCWAGAFGFEEVLTFFWLLRLGAAFNFWLFWGCVDIDGCLLGIEFWSMIFVGWLSGWFGNLNPGGGGGMFGLILNPGGGGGSLLKSIFP